MKKQKIAFVTYNRIGEGNYGNGVMKLPGKEIYIAQNGHRSEWAATPGYGTREDRISTRARTAESVMKSVNLEDMDHIFLYVGTNGGEEAIKQTRSISDKNITYVLCDCNGSMKERLIREAGNPSAKIIWSECGGRDTLERLLKKELASRD